MPTERAADDRDGRVIDAAARVMGHLRTELRPLEHEGVDDAELLHMVLMTWIDELADQGLADRESESVEMITKAMVEIGVRRG